MPSSYQPGIPTGLVFLDQDYANIQQNFQALDTYFGVDHTPYSIGTLTDPSGYHQAIHMVPVSTTSTNMPNNQPVNGYSATPGFGQLFSAQINDGIGGPDEALYYLSGGGNLIQMTRNFAPTLVKSAGASMLPGGIIINWGVNASASNSSAVVTFLQPFPTNIFSIQCTIRENSTSTTTVKVKTETGSGPVTGFTAETSSGSKTFYWIAIGI